jgi:hypothetical protein
MPNAVQSKLGPWIDFSVQRLSIEALLTSYNDLVQNINDTESIQLCQEKSKVL